MNVQVVEDTKESLDFLEASIELHYQEGQRARLDLAADLSSMHDYRSTREIAEWAKAKGLAGIDSHAQIIRLMAWGELVELADENGVVPRGTTPPEGTLRPLFTSRITIDNYDRLSLLKDALDLAAEEGVVISSRHVAAAVEAVHPTPKRQLQGKEIWAKVEKGLNSAKPTTATRVYTNWRGRKKGEMSGHEAYDLCSLIVFKFGTLESFAEAVRKEQEAQSGRPNVLPEIKPGQGSDPQPGGMGDRTAH